MDTATLIPLPVFDVVAQAAAEFLQQGMNVAIVGPPGEGTTSVASRVQQQLSIAKLPFAVFDCAAGGDIGPRLAEFAGPKRDAGQNGVVLIDHAASLPLAELKLVVARVREISTQNPTALLWLGSLDTRTTKAATGIELHTDTRTHLCLPELGRDDLLRLYRAISSRGERFWGQWGEAMLYFVLDWCGNDLALVEELVEHFYGDWTQRIWDESVAECLKNWLADSPSIRAYRARFAALPDPCKAHLRLLCSGGKLIFHRPEIHLETCDKMRRLFLDGFLCANLLPGYYQFRNLLARYVVEEQLGVDLAPIGLLRRSANGRVNELLQDVEVALRAMLRNVFRQMTPADVQSLLQGIKTERKLFEPELQRTLLEWAGKLPVPDPARAKTDLAKLLKEKREEFETTSNLWTKVCAVFSDSLGTGERKEPTPEQTVGCLTFTELTAILQTLASRVFLDKPRSNRIVDSPKDRWPDYMTKVRRLRNEAAHLRNISFQDIEDLLGILNAIRRDQLDFLIVP
jgi:hypothetical protein